MDAPSAGSIVLVPFPFSDLSESKLRPAAVLAEISRNDFVLCQVTSNPYADLSTGAISSAHRRGTNLISQGRFSRFRRGRAHSRPSSELASPERAAAPPPPSGIAESRRSSTPFRSSPHQGSRTCSAGTAGSTSSIRTPTRPGASRKRRAASARPSRTRRGRPGTARA